MTCRRQRRLRKCLRADAVLLEKRPVQRPLDYDRAFGRLGELHDPVRARGLRARKRQSAPEADEIMRVLDNVMLEPCLAQRPCREGCVEWHGANDFIDARVSVPSVVRKTIVCCSIHLEWRPQLVRDRKTRLRLLAGIDMRSTSSNSCACARAETSPRSRTPQSGFRARRPASKSALLGAV